MVQAIRHELSPVTVDEFLRLSLPDGKAELVRGEVQMSPPAGGRHGLVATNLLFLLGNHVRNRGLGHVFSDGSGYELAVLPRTVRVPDASFVRAERLSAEAITARLLPLAPDLAIEVLSPSETAADLEGKLRDYSTAGTGVIWVVDPVRRRVMVVSTDSPVRWLGENDQLDGGTVVEGFACRVSEIFEGLAP